MGTTTPPLLLTPEAAAAALGIGRTRMYHLLSEGTIESVRIGVSRRVPTEALARYVETLRTPQTAA